VCSIHHWSFPTQVAVLDCATGAVVSEYWHRGHLLQLIASDLEGRGHPSLLLGGVNDAADYKQATLVVLDPEHLAGSTSDPRGAPYYKEMAPARERHLVRFPRTVVNRDQEFNRVVELRVTSGRITVFVGEGIIEHLAPRIIYEISLDFQVIDVIATDEWRQQYRALQEQGRARAVAVEAVLEALKQQVVFV